MSLEGIEFLTNDFVATFTGAVLATNIITHFIKDFTPKSIDNKIVTLVVAFLILFLNQSIFGELSSETTYLIFLNTFSVAAAAMGNYEILNTKMARRKVKDAKMRETLENKEES